MSKSLSQGLIRKTRKKEVLQIYMDQVDDIFL